MIGSATGGSDAYDVIGYLVDESTGEVQERNRCNNECEHELGETNAVANKASLLGTQVAEKSVVVDSSEQIVQADAALRIDEVVIKKDTANIDKQELIKLIDRLYGFEEDGGRA